MKKTLIIMAILALAGCGNDAPSGTAATSTAAATQKPATTAATPATTATAAATTAATAAPAGAGAYRGLKDGNVAVAYIKDPKDEGQCGVVGATAEEKAKLTDDEIKKIAAVIKGEVTSTCPTDNIVGACRAFGIAVQYYGPKYTKDTAKKDCKVGSSRVDLQACKLEYSIVSPK